MIDCLQKILVLKGGVSSEREISLISANTYVDSLKELGYAVAEYDFVGDVCDLVSNIHEHNPSCVLNALHGGFGENGSIQAVLNMIKISYTHSGVLASSLAMNKYMSSKIFRNNSIPVPDNSLRIWDEFVENPNFVMPFVIKPYDGGSSAGVYIIENVSELNAITWEYGKYVLVEKYVPGIELTVGVVDGKAVEVTQICVNHGFYDYHNKYTVGESCHKLPADINDDIRNKIMQYSVDAYNILCCKGIARVDFRYNDVTNEVFALELNTQPGMTKTSLLPEQTQYVGISLNQLVQKILEQACYE